MSELDPFAVPKLSNDGKDTTTSKNLVEKRLDALSKNELDEVVRSRVYVVDEQAEAN